MKELQGLIDISQRPEVDTVTTDKKVNIIKRDYFEAYKRASF